MPFGRGWVCLGDEWRAEAQCKDTSRRADILPEWDDCVLSMVGAECPGHGCGVRSRQLMGVTGIVISALIRVRVRGFRFAMMLCVMLRVVLCVVICVMLRVMLCVVLCVMLRVVFGGMRGVMLGGSGRCNVVRRDVQDHEC